MPHGSHIYAKAPDTAKATICIYPQYDHARPNWKFVLRCCAEFLCINLPDQETDIIYSETTPSIRYHIYRIIGSSTANGIIPLKDNKICYLCKQ